MNPKTSHKIIAAGGMAVAIAIGVTVFFLRSTPVAPVAAADVPTAPVAATPAAVQEVVSQLPAVPAPAADIPAAPAIVAPKDTVSRKDTDRPFPPMADANPARHRQPVNTRGDINVGSPTVARSEAVAPITNKPVVADRLDRVGAAGDLNQAPMTASALIGSPEAGASVAIVASDSQITTDVKSAIAGEGLATDSSIGVTTTDGVVALSGSVTSQSAIDQVKDVARKVKDVKSVDTSGLILASL